MKESPRSPKIEQLPLHEGDWTLHPAVDWVIRHKNYFFGAFLLLLLLLILSLRWMTNQALDTERDYFQAEASYHQFERSIAAQNSPTEGSETWQDSFEKLQAILARRPELKPKYEGSLAQTFLALEDSSHARPLVSDILERTKWEGLGLYKKFTQTSLLIAENKLAESIKASQELQKELEDKGFDAHPLLYLFNLLRLSLLYQEENLVEEELKMWNELETLSLSPLVLRLMNEAWQAGGLSLTEYIQERKRAHSALVN